MEKTIKKQKIIIAILSIIIIALSMAIVGTQVSKNIEESTYSVEFTKKYTKIISREIILSPWEILLQNLRINLTQHTNLRKNRKA